MQRINDWIMQSYHTDRQAFYLECISALFNIAASLALAITAVSPDLRWIYPAYFIGSVTMAIACQRRQLAWPLLLMVYFCGVNILGWLRAMEIL